MATLTLSRAAMSKGTEADGTGSTMENRLPASALPRPMLDRKDKGKWQEGLGEANADGTMATAERSMLGGDWLRIRKLEMPIFSSDDLDGWVYGADRYFEINGFSEKERLAAIEVSLEASALSWFQWMEARDPFRTWESFRQKLLLRFRSTQEGSLRKILGNPASKICGGVPENVRSLSSTIGGPT